MTNSKKQIFNIKLYIDALKQLKVIGIVMLIIVGFISVSACILSEPEKSAEVVNAMSFFSYTIAAPVMTLYLFRFLTSRKASDVFHSMPYTRTCMYISYMLAIFTWSYATVLINYVCYIVLECKFDFWLSAKYNISVIICILLVMASVSIAQGITGTIFTNVAVSGIIIFVPRILIFYIISIIGDICHYVNIYNIIFPFNYSDNLLICLLVNTFSYYGIEEISIGVMVYTLILTIIYFAIALILFNRRKSETAENAAKNRYVQMAIRSIIALIICLIPLSEIINENFSDEYFTMELSGIIILYVFAIIVYFLYELLSTRKVKNLVKAVPGIIIVAVLNLAIYMIVGFSINSLADFKPTAEEVEYIAIEYSEAGNRWNINSHEYVYKLADGMKITDEDIIKRLTEDYDRYVKDENFGEAYYDIAFCIDGKIYHRYVGVSEKLDGDIYKYLCNCPKIIEKYKQLPEYEDLESVDLYYVLDVKDEEIEKLYRCYREEFAQLEDSIYDTLNSIFDEYIEIRYEEKGQSYVIALPINPKLPKSFEMYMNIVNEGGKVLLENLTEEVMFELYSTYYDNISIERYDTTKETPTYEDEIYISYYDVENFEELAEALETFLEECEATYQYTSADEEVYYVVMVGTDRVLFSASEKSKELFDDLSEKYRDPYS